MRLVAASDKGMSCIFADAIPLSAETWELPAPSVRLVRMSKSLFNDLSPQDLDRLVPRLLLD